MRNLRSRWAIAPDAHGGLARGGTAGAQRRARGLPVRRRQPGGAARPACYCGCGNVGHTSNLDCYLADIDESGTITFDNHALGCTLCVDITQDAMRLLREGRELPAIREYVDARYARFGPSNMP